MGNLVRRYKIHQVEPVLSNYEIINTEYIKEIINNLVPYSAKEYENKIIFYFYKNKIYFEYNIAKKELWVINILNHMLNNDVDVEYKDNLDFIDYFFKRNIDIPFEKIYEGNYNKAVERIEKECQNNLI